MSDTAWDAKGNVDKDLGSGVVVRQLLASTHLQIPGALWAACRSNAVLGQSDFDAWVAGSALSSAVKSWYAGLPSDCKTAIRESALLLAA